MKNAFGVVEEFERRVAEYAGAPYAVAVDCCTNALFLSLECIKAFTGKPIHNVRIPAKTYCSVPMAVIHAGGEPEFNPNPWVGIYHLWPYPVTDGAKRFTKGMYSKGFHCLSFHSKKHLKIGRGGMILLDNEEAYEWLKRARYDGREGLPYDQEKVTQIGWHMYMTPEQAARGLQLLDTLPAFNEDLTEDYPDLRDWPIFARKPAVVAV